MTADDPSRPAGRPTLRQVAAMSGVSIKTASRVFNDEPHVTPTTAARVWAAAEQLGFRRNRVASELKSGTASVGLIIGDLANPFYARIARGAEQVFRGRGLQLVSASTEEDPELERMLAGQFIERRVRALLIVPSSDDQSYLEQDRLHGLPLVFLDRPPAGLEADTVVLDNFSGARAAAEHLLAGGHRRVGLVGDFSRLSTHRERIAGFEAAMEGAGVESWRRYLRTECHDVLAAEQSTRELLQLPEPPTALFATNNRTTAGVLRGLRDVGRGQAFVGFDDFDLADVLGVTVVAHDPVMMGRRSAELALARVDGDDAPPRHVVLPTWLVARGSGELSPPRPD